MRRQSTGRHVSSDARVERRWSRTFNASRGMNQRTAFRNRDRHSEAKAADQRCVSHDHGSCDAGRIGRCTPWGIALMLDAAAKPSSLTQHGSIASRHANEHHVHAQRSSDNIESGTRDCMCTCRNSALHRTQSTPIQQIRVRPECMPPGSGWFCWWWSGGASYRRRLAPEELQVLNQRLQPPRALRNKGNSANFGNTASATLPYGDVPPERVATNPLSPVDRSAACECRCDSNHSGRIYSERLGRVVLCRLLGDLGMSGRTLSRRARQLASLVEHLLMISAPSTRTVQRQERHVTQPDCSAQMEIAQPKDVGRGGLGQHNDCFIGVGGLILAPTLNPDVERPWLEEHSRCAVTGRRPVCAVRTRSLYESCPRRTLSRFHWTFAEW